ncbi:uncharacterized protein LOC133892527 [Phragmites australis]|uniref:uncharacterized protein LOC133892527 n=1 Tax=Phragmites australis TaxID=29695 RepID=UPI002D769FFD|nr:uncharacterized protein LOC133892527 [Phragmites australis]
MLQLSESTDILGIAIKCLQLFTPLFKSTVEIIRNKLIQLPTQDLSWVPHVDSRQKEHWDNLHSFRTQWFRPNPLCCKHLDQHELRCSSNIDTSKLPDVSLEPVIEVNLQCHVSLSGGNISAQGSKHLIAGLLFMPHGSSEDLLPADKSSAIAVIDGEEKRCLHTVITLEQLEEIMLRKAIDHFRQNAEATVYQMLWKSKHNTAYIQVEKASTKMQSTGKLIRGARNGNMSRQYVQACVIPHFLNMWVAQAPIWLQGSIVKWVQREAPEILDHHVTWINDGKREK